MNYSMMFKRAALIFLSVLLLFLPFVKAKAREEGLPAGEVLIVYSDNAKESILDNVYEIVGLLTYEGVQVTFASAAGCAGALSEYQSVIFYDLEKYPSELIGEIQNLEEEKNSRLMFVGNPFFQEYLDRTERHAGYVLWDEEVGTFTYDFADQSSKQSLVPLNKLILYKEETDYTSGRVWADAGEGYFCGRWGTLTHISVSDFDNPLVKEAFARELSIWRQGKENAKEDVRYLVLNKIYPFQDPAELLSVIRELAEKEVPFVVTVMPIYLHGDYPAMQHFCEVLRYAQGNGGVILLHAPVNQMTDFDVDMVNEAISTAVNFYVNQGVYPMGLQVPENWIRNRDAIEVMSRFQTILVSDETDEQVAADWKEAKTNLVYRNSHQWLASAVYLDLTKDKGQLYEKIKECENSPLPLKNLWDMSHSVWTNTDTITYRNGILFLNGVQVEKSFEPTEYEEDFSYNRNRLQRFSRDLTGENQKLIVAVAALSVLFLLFILVARKNNRSRFFYQEEEEDKDEYWENKG